MKKLSSKTTNALICLILILVISSCNKSEIIPGQSFEDISIRYNNEGITKAAIGENAYYLLFEELSPLTKSPGSRYLKKTSLGGSEIMRIEADNHEALIDFCISDEAIFVLYSSQQHVEIRKYSLGGAVQESAVIWTNSQNQPVSTHDRGRLAIKNNELAVAIRTEDNVARLYSLYAASLTINWTQLIEPANNFAAYGMTGGSYDTFEQLAHPYMIFMDLDDEGNAYVVVPALFGSSIYLHNQHFGENLSHMGETFVSAGFESDALVTKVSSTGARLYTVVAGSEAPDECYGIKVENGAFYLHGRTAKPTSTMGYAWDAYVAKYRSGDGSPVYTRSFHVDQSEVIYDVAETNTGDLMLAGSAGWTQNPLGYSVSGAARKLVAVLDASGNFKEELELEPGARHNQIRSITYKNGRIWLGGWENGPGTHTGDADPNLVFADAFWTSFHY